MKTVLIENLIRNILIEFIKTFKATLFKINDIIVLRETYLKKRSYYKNILQILENTWLIPVKSLFGLLQLR